MKTELEHLANPNACVHCDSMELDGGDFPEFEEGRVFMRVKCLDCGVQWDDIFTLSSFEAIAT